MENKALERLQEYIKMDCTQYDKDKLWFTANLNGGKLIELINACLKERDELMEQNMSKCIRMGYELGTGNELLAKDVVEVIYLIKKKDKYQQSKQYLK